MKHLVAAVTANDLPEHRRAVLDACIRMAVLPTTMEDFSPDDSEARAQCLSMIDQADLYIGVFGFRYGHVPPGETRSLPELEYDRAVERGIPRLIFLMAQSHTVRIGDVDTGESAVKLQQFKERVTQNHVVYAFTSPGDLQARVIQALASLLQELETKRTEAPAKIGKQRELLRVFVASPRDVAAERQCMPRVIESLNRTLGRLAGVVIELWRWEADAPPSAGEPQALINPELDESDAVVVILWNRLGMATKSGPTGTETEVVRAMERWNRLRRPQVMIYFCQRAAILGREELKQRLQVLDFREKVSSLALTVDYENVSDFEWRVRDDLFAVLNRLRTQT